MRETATRWEFSVEGERVSEAMNAVERNGIERETEVVATPTL
jgi:hypothetical protein